ncbi:MAG: glycosyltransferase [candidate division KSB1 bacterium]|nr:glycosyltransferase [candidate division KSB1 bacterium]
MKILYVTGREASYSRTRNVRKGMEKAGLEVISVSPPRHNLRYYPFLLRRAWAACRTVDAIVVGFYGQILLPLLKLTGKPILFDVYISTFDTLILDRRLASVGSPLAKLSWLLDHLSLRLADRVVLETQDHIRDYARKFRVPENKFHRVFLCADEDVIYPRGLPSGDGFWVHFHGEYAPFHGVRHIIDAARLLAPEGVRFRIIGRGITSEEDRAYAQRLGLRNIEFIDRVPYEALAEYMSRAHICLGFFGNNPRAERVFTNKVVESLGAGRPLITRVNKPVQELLRHRWNAFLCEPGSGEALAEAVRTLREDPDLRDEMGKRARATFLENCTTAVLGAQFRTILEGMVNHDRDS